MNYTQPSITAGTSSSSFGTYAGQYQQRRPMYGNYSNTTTSAVARENLGGYNQNIGTLSQSGLRIIDGILHNGS